MDGNEGEISMRAMQIEALPKQLLSINDLSRRKMEGTQHHADSIGAQILSNV
jgi:hypothetical protein